MNRLYQHYQQLSRTAVALFVMLLTMTAQTAWAQTNYTVTLKAGDGTGADVTISSAEEANVAASQSAASNGQFWREGDKLWFKFPDCPNSFSAPSGSFFVKWNESTPGTVMTITADKTLTAVWAAVGYEFDYDLGTYYKITSMSPNKEVGFASGYGISELEIPSTVTLMGHAFSVTSIESGAFSSSNLTSITIPASVKTIGEYTFYGCSGLQSITIPASVETIGNFAFIGCSNLTSFTLNSNPVIGFDALPDNATVTMNLTANEGATGEYWTTFYNENYSFAVDAEKTKVYKAAVSGSRVNLTEVADIHNDKAVILKSTASPITLTLTTSPSTTSADFDGNELKGGSDVPAGYDAYILSAAGDPLKMGFYMFDGSLTNPATTLNPNKAHLEIPTPPSGARGFIGFDEDDATGIEAVENVQCSMFNVQSDSWYSLDGRRLSAQPTQKGIYVKNGQKFIVK